VHHEQGDIKLWKGKVNERTHATALGFRGFDKDQLQLQQV